MSTRVYVCFGTGGVGKTTISAALGTALAKRGARTLVMTFDPARRLAEAFGVEAAAVPVPVTPTLTCYMPEAEASAQRTVHTLFGHDRTRAAQLAQNPVLATLVDGLSGMHEIGALAELTSLAPGYDAVVIDTAPTRHALELLTLPERIAALVDSRALRWLADAARARLGTANAEKQSAWSRLVDFGQARVVTELTRSLGGAPIAACMELVSALMDERETLSAIARSAQALLASRSTTYAIVGSPRPGLLDDVAFFRDGIARVAQPPQWLVLNRFVERQPDWPAQLTDHPRASPALRNAARTAGAELRALAEYGQRAVAGARARFPQLRVARVPRLDAAQPSAVVAAASVALLPMLQTDLRVSA
ncbi:MAG: hypothetical protein RL385_2380 [Pseudomonadota bacterium]|jgi:anion-transporting  ArsA/GET3 family ATPase